MKSFNDHTGLRNKDKGWMTPFDFHGSKPVEYYYLHMIGHIPFICKIIIKVYFNNKEAFYGSEL